MAATVLLDTDVFSFLFKRDTRAGAYERYLTNAQACLSFQSVAELRLWSITRHWGEPRRASLERAIKRCIVFSADDATSALWATVTAHRRQIGQPMDCGDARIAATALRHNLPLLTHNAAHYRDVAGLNVISH
jgi:predicted nucleic acid-binding protein